MKFSILFSIFKIVFSLPVVEEAETALVNGVRALTRSASEGAQVVGRESSLLLSHSPVESGLQRMGPKSLSLGSLDTKGLSLGNDISGLERAASQLARHEPIGATELEHAHQPSLAVAPSSHQVVPAEPVQSEVASSLHQGGIAEAPSHQSEGVVPSHQGEIVAADPKPLRHSVSADHIHDHPSLVEDALHTHSAPASPIGKKSPLDMAATAKEAIASKVHGARNVYISKPMAELGTSIKSTLRQVAEKLRLIRKLPTQEAEDIHAKAHRLIFEIQAQIEPLVKAADKYHVRAGTSSAKGINARKFGINAGKELGVSPIRNVMMQSKEGLMGESPVVVEMAGGKAAAGKEAIETIQETPHVHHEIVSSLEDIQKRLADSGPLLEKLAGDLSKITKESKTIIEILIEIVTDFRVIASVLFASGLSGGVVAGSVIENAAQKTGQNNTIVPKVVQNIAFN